MDIPIIFNISKTQESDLWVLHLEDHLDEVLRIYDGAG